MEIAQPILSHPGPDRSSVTCDYPWRVGNFRFSTEPACPSSGIEPFVCFSMIPAMKTGEEITAPWPVSAKMAGGFPRIQERFNDWYPELRPARIHAPLQPSTANTTSRGVGCFFSGGVDSFYSALRFNEEVDTLIFVHGFDIPLANVELRASVSHELRAAAAALGKKFIEVETNARELLDGFGNWGKHTHGSALVSVAHLLSGYIRKIHIASSGTRDAHLGWASHPILDHFWSSETLEIVHDDDVITRVDKTFAIARSDVALAHLRVCWENPSGSYNCSQCEKCMRTMMTLRLAGVLDRCRTFDKPLDLVRVAGLQNVTSIARRRFYEDILDAARLAGDHEIAHAVQQVLNRRPPKERWLVKKAGRLRRKVLGWCCG